MNSSPVHAVNEYNKVRDLPWVHGWADYVHIMAHYPALSAPPLPRSVVSVAATRNDASGLWVQRGGRMDVDRRRQLKVLVWQTKIDRVVD